MFKKILVAYDGGDISMRALDKAIELAKDTPAEIHLISVYGENDIQALRLHGTQYPANANELFHPGSEDYKEAEKNYITLFQVESAERVRQAGIPVHPIVTKGKPHQAIVEHAKKVRACLIVTGTHNQGTAAKLLLGSVADSLIRHAPCPVMVVGEK
ncbi:MAG: universal stress protein [Syntrophomonadaceae bacterium]|nr:universal stress protein [Syntrophomonadaceae bacterium]